MLNEPFVGETPFLSEQLIHSIDAVTGEADDLSVRGSLHEREVQREVLNHSCLGQRDAFSIHDLTAWCRNAQRDRPSFLHRLPASLEIFLRGCD